MSEDVYWDPASDTGNLVIREIPPHVYREWDAVNSSRLNKLKDGSLLHFLANHSESTNATKKGSVYHSLVLTPNSFEESYRLQKSCEGRTTKGTRCSKPAQGVYDGKSFCSIHRPSIAADPVQIVTKSAWDEAHRMMEATLQNDMASFLLDAAQDREVAYVWTEPLSEMRCKALIDADSADESAIIDLKSSQGPSPDQFLRSVLKYGYHRQAAFYLNGALNVNRARDKFFWIVQESVPPYDTVVYEPSKDMIEHAAETLYRWLVRIGEAKKQEEWPGFGAYGPISLDLPDWMSTTNDEGE